MAGIAIFEGDAPVRRLMTEWLTGEGYHVTNASADDARSIDGIVLIVVDLFMPRRFAAEQLQKARTAYPGVPIVAISGQFGAGVRCEGPAARALGVERVVAKPFDRRTLLHAVRSVTGPPIVAAP